MSRYLPILLGLLSWGGSFVLWPGWNWNEQLSIRWLDIVLLGMVGLLLCWYGVRLLLLEDASAASSLRAKLVMALVAMLLLPAILLQGTASYVVHRGLDSWFDVRVESLLDRAMKLARGFYHRIDHELRQSLIEVSGDDGLRAYLSTLPLSIGELPAYMNDLSQHHDWESMQIFDRNERLIASVDRRTLGSLKPIALSDQARLSLSLGKITTETQMEKGHEYIVGYAPVIVHQNVVALIRAAVSIPDGLIAHARAVEHDYRKYNELARHRESMGSLFTDLMILITLVVTVLAGWVALVFARRMTRPVERLAGALQRVSEGDLDVIVQAESRDELASLVNSFNVMARKLKRNIEAVEQAQRELREALHDSQRRKQILENLLANLDSGVLLLNHDGQVELSNQAFFRLVEIDVEMLRNIDQERSLTTMNMPASTARIQMLLHILEELKSSREQTLQREMDIDLGTTQRHLLVRGVSLTAEDTSGFRGYLLVIDDLTDMAEAQRHRAWVEVARSVAHEIKNPLTPIKLAAERLRRRKEKGRLDDRVFEQCTQTIIRQTNRLLRLTSDFSTLASLPRPRRNRVDVQLFTHELADLYAAYPRVEVHQPMQAIHCDCDADQVRQVLINLIDNALAATEESRQPVRLYVTEEDGVVCFHVEDEGSGIQLDRPQMVFDSYFSTKAEGSGLGLSISARIAREHGGELLLLSTSKPTHFCLRIPPQEL